MVRISKARLSMEDGRIDRAVIRDFGETVVGGADGVLSSSSYSANIENGNIHHVILNADCTFSFTNPGPIGTSTTLVLILKQDAVGGWVPTWPISVLWISGAVPTLTTEKNRYEILTFTTTDAGARWYGAQTGSDYAEKIELWACGEAATGRLGTDATLSRSSPVQIGTSFNWSHVDGGNTHTVAVKTDGTLWTWGDNGNGQLGQNIAIATDRSSPTQVGDLTSWKNVSGGGLHTTAIQTDGSLWSWGYNSDGQLGVGNTAMSSSPTQVGASTNWSQHSAGYQHSAAIKTDGTLWTWGKGTQGRLGLNNTNSTSSPSQVGNLTTWGSVSIGQYRSAAVKTDGTLWVWGDNSNGELGLNNSGATHRSSPAQIGGETEWSSVSVGRYHAIATKNNGTLWGWGLANFGEIGMNSVQSHSSPVQIGGETDWSMVSAGSYFSTALKTDGTLWSWGQATAGQGGLEVVTNRSSPTQVGTSTNWKHVETGTSHTVALRYPSGAQLTYIGTTVDTTDQTTYTFSSVDLGADVQKLLIVGVAANDAGTGGSNMEVSSGTIDGGEATVNVTVNTERAGSAIMSCELSGGTSGTITVTLTNSAGRAAISVWTLTGYRSATPTGTDFENSTGSDTSLGLSLTTSDGGAIVMVGQPNASGWSWDTGFARTNIDIEGGNYFVSNDANNISAGTSTVTFSGGSTRASCAAAAFR